MQSKTYGYIRVSTKDQNEDRQRIALLEAGVPLKQIILDKQSGKDFNRPGYRRLCKKMKPGDRCFLSKASIAWAETITKYWSSGGI